MTELEHRPIDDVLADVPATLRIQWPTTWDRHPSSGLAPSSRLSSPDTTQASTPPRSASTWNWAASRERPTAVVGHRTARRPHLMFASASPGRRTRLLSEFSVGGEHGAGVVGKFS